MLYDPARHESLQASPWNKDVALSRLRLIMGELDREFSTEKFWLPHPEDGDWSSPDTPMTSLFWGAIGTAWAFLALQEKGALASTARDYRQELARICAAYKAKPDTGEIAPGFLFGKTGILTILERFAPSVDGRRELETSLTETIARPELELMWAAPGAIVAARLLYDRTSDEMYRDALVAGAEALLKTWGYDDEAGCHLWVQDLYGHKLKYLGGVHGFAGNVFALLKALPFLTSGQRELVLSRSAESFCKLAMRDGGLSNWAPGIGSQKIMVQWCHGAPGFITSFAEYPVGVSPLLDQILLEAGELVWAAGPLNKPFGLCHGNAGNGYAFLKLYRRTGDPKWLERARAFAMHAIAQSDREAARHGRRRSGLFTGDAGLCVYLWSCIEGDAGWPMLDWV